ncbi:MAG: tRNA (cytidine(34)-2'-O)-methyltransferase [Ruminococcus sp.]|jgi:tRNA (cytidine/uridine-2'-O-)-methyltransferase|nr:tRNA (cytidine(34)-2'-O)-methyltransferase [Ruminococcus sp.]
MSKFLNLVLCEPQIPQNTGNISRTCAVTGAALHLIRPLGFEITESRVKRAGLDYWDKLSIFYYDGLDEFLSKHEKDELFFFSTKASLVYTDITYPENAYLIFGREDAGLPETVLAAYSDRAVKLPMRDGLRSLNLSNSVAVAVYEALRQQGFPGLS